MGGEELVERKRGVTMEETCRGVGGGQVAETCGDGRSGWINWFGEVTGYVTGVGTKVEDAGEVSLDVLISISSHSCLRSERGDERTSKRSHRRDATSSRR